MKKNILVAEDDQAIVEALSLILSSEGYKVSTALTEKEIRESIQKHPHLILLDIRLSGVSGADLCAACKADAQTQDIPIILMSANPDIEKIAKQVQANDWIRKPFELSHLLTIIEKHL